MFCFIVVFTDSAGSHLSGVVFIDGDGLVFVSGTVQKRAVCLLVLFVFKVLYQ